MENTNLNYENIQKKQKIKITSQKKFKESVFIIIMLIVPIINFLVFWVYVNFSQISLAFKGLDDSGHYYFTLNNFVRVFEIFGEKNSVLLDSLKNTMIFWSFNNLLMFPLTIFLAYLMKKNLLGTKIFRIVFYLPAIISSVALTSMLKYIISGDAQIGIYYRLFNNMEYTPNFLSENAHAMNTLLLYSFFTGFCTNMILISGAMARVPDELVESAAIDGATMSVEFFKIYIPLCWPTFSTLLIMAAAGIFNASGQVLLLTQGQGNTFTFSYFMYVMVKDNASYMIPSALGLLMTLIAFPIVLLARHFINKVYADVEF